MKQLYILLFTVIALSACKKELSGPNVIIDPFPPKILSSDTLRTGQLWGLAIGQPVADSYARIQALRTERNINNLSIVNNVYTTLDSLQTRLPLYTSLYLDSKIGSSTGIQINFINAKVSVIYTNDGIRLSRWPINTDNDATIAVGDNISRVYQKLVNIKKTAYANKLERISIFYKDIASAYDPQMSVSPQWYFASVINDKTYNMVQLNISAGKIASIYSTVFESQ